METIESFTTEAHWYFVGRIRRLFNRYLCDKFGPKKACEIAIQIKEIGV